MARINIISLVSNDAFGVIGNFGQIKDLVKTFYGARWNADTKFWELPFPAESSKEMFRKEGFKVTATKKVVVPPAAPKAAPPPPQVGPTRVYKVGTSGRKDVVRLDGGDSKKDLLAAVARWKERGNPFTVRGYDARWNLTGEIQYSPDGDGWVKGQPAKPVLPKTSKEVKAERGHSRWSLTSTSMVLYCRQSGDGYQQGNYYRKEAADASPVAYGGSPKPSGAVYGLRELVDRFPRFAKTAPPEEADPAPDAGDPGPDDDLDKLTAQRGKEIVFVAPDDFKRIPLIGEYEVVGQTDDGLSLFEHEGSGIEAVLVWRPAMGQYTFVQAPRLA